MKIRIAIGTALTVIAVIAGIGFAEACADFITGQPDKIAAVIAEGIALVVGGIGVLLLDRKAA